MKELVRAVVLGSAKDGLYLGGIKVYADNGNDLLWSKFAPNKRLNRQDAKDDALFLYNDVMNGQAV